MTCVILLGPSAAGKTAFLTRHRNGSFTPDYLATTACETHELIWHTNHGLKTLQVCELPGHASENETRDACQTADASIIVLDMNSDTVLQDAEKWLSRFRQAKPTAPVVVYFNKLDTKRKLGRASIAGGWCVSQGCKCWFLSALSNYNYEKAFLHLLRVFVATDLQLLAEPATMPAVAETPILGIECC